MTWLSQKEFLENQIRDHEQALQLIKDLQTQLREKFDYKANEILKLQAQLQRLKREKAGLIQ